MNDKMVMELYSEDISRIKLPPISDKVLREMREKKEIGEKMPENPEHHTAPSKTHRKIPTKYIFAALLTLLVVSVPIIIILTNDASVPVTPEGGNITDTSSNVSTVKEESDNPSAAANALERIKEQQLYGTVSLSGKTEMELDELLLTYNGDSNVYEDDNFIYNFDSSGNLIELVNKEPVDENGSAVNEEVIKNKTKKLLSVYFPEWNDYSYDTEITNFGNAIPAWRIVLINKTDELTIQKMTMSFDIIGNIRRIILSGTSDDIGIISKKDAIQIALTEIRNSKYNIRDFKDEDIEITVEIKTNDEEPYYFVTINKLQMEEDIIVSIYLKISINDGKIIDIIF